MPLGFIEQIGTVGVMKVSVILCTYNRCESLAKALESASALSLPSMVEWEVLVIDNASSDQTRQVVEDFCRRYAGRFRYVFEPRQGKSHALNTGIREARGDVLAFMDDDVTVPATWLQNLTVNLHNGAWQGAGGRILPEKNFLHPRWLAIGERYALAPLALFDLGDDARDLSEPPFGTNMAFRKSLFHKYGYFRTDLGPQPGNLIRNEDTEFGHRVLAAGERLRYEPSAVVYHLVPTDRLHKKYFLAWWFGKGRADVRESGVPHDFKWFIAGIPLVMVRRLVVWTVRWVIAVEPSRRFSCKLSAWAKAGMILECYRQNRDPNSIMPGVANARTAAETAKGQDPINVG
jgi:glycosyltransferase involved in cell wall biosynthesis